MGQQAAILCGQKVVVDGNFGPMSAAALNACDPRAWVLAMADQMRDYYNGVVTRRPASAIFLRNWLRRASWGA